MNLNDIKKDISSKNFAPYYFIHGEEPFFIDKAVELLQNGIMEEYERDFNQTIFYGKDADPSAIIETAKRFPMMAERCGVIIKEGQDFKSSSYEALENLLASPTPSTVTVFAFKGKIDKRRKFFKTLLKAGKTFESSKLYENKIPNWIQDHVGAHGLKINQKATLLLANQLGTNLHKLDDALSKLAVVCPKGSEITPAEIEYNIGISRDYNVFELINAYAENNAEKIVRIAFHLSNNEK